MNSETQHLISRIQEDISQIAPTDNLEASHIKETLEWSAQTDKIFRIKKPDIPPKHLVSYFVLIDPKQRSILLCDHIKAQLWLPSGRHVESGEHPADTVRREAHEELGIQAVFLNDSKPFFLTVNETGGLTPGHTDVSLWYLIEGSRFDFIHFDRAEFNDIEWFTFDEILDSDLIIFDRHMHRFTKKLLEYI